MNEIISLSGKYHRDFIGIYPRIATIYPKNEERKNQTIIGIMPDKILEFLDDLLGRM